MCTRVLIVAQQTALQRLLEAAIAAEKGMEVVGNADDGQKAANLAVRLNPDVVLMTIRLPVMDGVEAASLIRAACPAIRIIALAGSASPAELAAMRKAGAAAIVDLTQGLTRLLSLIRGKPS